MANFEKRDTAIYARKRITKLEARIIQASHSDASAVIHGKPARERERLDRITLKRWQERLAEIEAGQP